MAGQRNADRRAARWVLGVALAALVWWPLGCRYTSFGLDLECERDGRVDCTFYRLRWPGDGSVALAWIAEHRAVASGPLEPFDLGASFLQPAPDLRPDGFWQRHGFWWVAVEPGAGPAPPIVAGADRALLVGVPHWAVVVVLLVAAASLQRRCGG
jgi:hypothetical protein